MCVASMIADHYRDKWWPAQPYVQPSIQWNWYNGPSREEFDKLRSDVDEMIALLKRAKLYDIAAKQPDCEMDEKMALLRRVAELVGVDLDKAIAVQPSLI